MTPFRWDVRRREQLGTLLDGPETESYPEFVGDLRACAARVISAAGDADLAFVGRSPESLFDYLSGVLAPTDWAERTRLVNLSMRFRNLEDARLRPDGLQAMKDHMTSVGLSPAQLVVAPRPVALVDLVHTGATFENLSAFVLEWAAQTVNDVASVARKIRFVGVVARKKTSPNTWRWQQHAPWLEAFESSAVTNVSVPWRLWGYLGNDQDKVSDWNPPWRWGDPSASRPSYDAGHLEALRLAVRLFDTGSETDERQRFSDALVRQRAFRSRWCRRLVGELRGTAA